MSRARSTDTTNAGSAAHAELLSIHDAVMNPQAIVESHSDTFTLKMVKQFVLLAIGSQAARSEHDSAIIERCAQVADAFAASRGVVVAAKIRDLRKTWKDGVLKHHHSVPPVPLNAMMRLLHSAEAVCWFDWSDNDSDAVACMERLREAVRGAYGGGG